MTAARLASLPNPLPIRPVRRPFNLTIVPPGSKSLTNRALLLAALGRGESHLTGALTNADDAERMMAALRTLGAEISITGDAIRVRGVGGRWRTPPSGVTLNLNNAGTATRFLTAAAVLSPPGAGPITIDGNARMRRRPIGELSALLSALGLRVEHVGTPGCPPVRVFPPDDASLLADEIEAGPTASSQFVSALMLVAPSLPRGLRIRFTGPVTSASYIEMTIALLRRLGVRVEGEPPRPVRIPPTPPEPFRLAIEPDASGATYFFGAAAVVPGARIVVPGLSASMQGDARFVEVLEQMGARVERAPELAVSGPDLLRGIETDLALMPDTAMTLAAVACFAKTPTTIRGLRTLRVKETDRIGAIATELGRIGARVEVFGHAGPQGEPDEGLRVTPPPNAPAPGDAVVAFQTYDDHRMAMALSLIGLRRAGVLISNPACVEKTYPGYWADLAILGAVG